MCVYVWGSEISDGVFCDVMSDLLRSLLYVTWTVYYKHAESELYYSWNVVVVMQKGCWDSTINYMHSVAY